MHFLEVVQGIGGAAWCSSELKRGSTTTEAIVSVNQPIWGSDYDNAVIGGLISRFQVD